MDRWIDGCVHAWFIYLCMHACMLHMRSCITSAGRETLGLLPLRLNICVCVYVSLCMLMYACMCTCRCTCTHKRTCHLHILAHGLELLQRLDFPQQLLVGCPNVRMYISICVTYHTHTLSLSHTHTHERAGISERDPSERITDRGAPRPAMRHRRRPARRRRRGTLCGLPALCARRL